VGGHILCKIETVAALESLKRGEEKGGMINPTLDISIQVERKSRLRRLPGIIREIRGKLSQIMGNIGVN
jgi:hypothetical protein